MIVNFGVSRVHSMNFHLQRAGKVIKRDKNSVLENAVDYIAELEEKLASVSSEGSTQQIGKSTCRIKNFDDEDWEVKLMLLPQSIQVVMEERTVKSTIRDCCIHRALLSWLFPLISLS